MNAPPDSLWGKITPHYWEDPRVPERMFAKMPDIKLIALLRNPIDRLFSHYRFLVRRGVEPRPFEEVVFDKNSRKYHYYTPLGEYGRILNSFLKYFPPHQLQVAFSEDLERQPESVLDSLMAFLGLTPGYRPENLGKRYNVGGTQTRLTWLISFAKSTWPVKWAWRALPERIRVGIGKWYFFEVAPVPEKAAPLQPEIRQQLVNYYKSDILELQDIIRTSVPWKEFEDGSA